MLCPLFHLVPALLLLRTHHLYPGSHISPPGHVSRDCPQSTNGGNFNSANSNSAATPETTPAESEAIPAINWKQIYLMAEENRMAKWKDEPPIVKQFYEEHPDVASETLVVRLIVYSSFVTFVLG